MYDSKNSITLKISGIVRQSPDSDLGILSQGLAYSDELSQLIIDKAIDSDIVKAQKEASYNIMTKKDMSVDDKTAFLSVLGGNATPFMVMVYPSSFADKDAVTAYLDAYNKGKAKEDTIIYTDLAKTISGMTGGIMNGITLVLIAFAAISLIVSLIMISIITYTSVLERTKEIGILKALGARKKDITRVFDAETCILGIFSGVLGIAIALLCTIPINAIIFKVAELKNVAQLQPIYAIALIIISTALTMLGGHIPAKMASNKDAVEALRSE
jgi:putative ABC transport system permease protein